MKFPLSLIAWACTSLALTAADWKVGLASTKITPEQPLMLAGYAARNKPFEKVEDDLFAKALALEDAAGNRGVIVTTDLIGITKEFAESLGEPLQKKTGLRRAQVVLNASHTHTGPSLSLNDQPRSGFSAEQAKATSAYTRRLQERIIDIIAAALADLAPAELSWGTGVAHLAMNRREFTPKGVKLGVNPRGLVDRSVPVLRIARPDGTLRGVLFGYACHNTTLSQSDYFVSPDYAGYAQRFIQEKASVPQAMFLSGCSGAANPYPRGSLSIAREHGAALGGEVCRILGTKLQPVRGPLRSVASSVALPVRQTPRHELEKLAATGNVREKASAAQMLQSLDRGDVQPTHYEAPLSVWQFGQDLTWVAMSGEVVADYVPLIERAVGPLNLWLSSYSNDYFGYVPSARMLAEGGYETLGLFRANGIFTPDVEPVLVRRVAEVARQAGRKIP